MRSRRKRILSLNVWNLVAWISAAAFVGGLAAAVSATPQGDQQAQIEKGRQAVGQACATCHPAIMRMIQAQKNSPEQWRDTVYSMIGRGAEILPDEIEPLTAFLAANSGGNREATGQTPGGGRQGAGRADQQTPEAEGRAILQRSCQQCHDMATATKKLPADDWNAVIAKMMTYGAKLTPADQQKLSGYLNGLAK